MLQKNESIPVSLARESIVYYLKYGKKLALNDSLPEEFLTKRAGTFVSLKKEGRLRGCIGTFLPTKNNIALEIINNAISAATQDPRFFPVTLDEVEDLSITVDILTAPEKVENINSLDPKKYGIIISCGYRKGLLLPALEGVDSVEQQINIARQKAGIYENEDYSIERFEVKRFY